MLKTTNRRNPSVAGVEQEFTRLPHPTIDGAEVLRIDIGRPQTLGNPFTSKPSRLGAWVKRGVRFDVVTVRTASEAVEKFHGHLRAHWTQRTAVRRILERIADFCEAHQDNDVEFVCWCHPAPCHGHVLEYAIKGILNARAQLRERD